MKKNKTLMIMLAVLLLLIVLFFSISSWNRHREKKEAQLEADSVTYVTDLDSLSSISYTSDGKSMSFEKQDGTWYYSRDKEIPITQSYITSIENTCSNLAAIRVIDSPDAMSDYGLDTPAYTIEVTDTDGKSHTLAVGNSSGEDYYLLADGDENTVYTVSSSIVSTLQFDLDTIAAKDTLPSINSENLIKAVIHENGQDRIYSIDGTGQTEAVNTVAGGLGAMDLSTCASYHAGQDELTSYGLDETLRTTVTLTYKDTDDKELTYTLYVGSTNKDGDSRYVQVQDSKMVYLVSTDVLANLLAESY